VAREVNQSRELKSVVHAELVFLVSTTRSIKAEERES
jgi:hypothetical protein